MLVGGFGASPSQFLAFWLDRGPPGDPERWHDTERSNHKTYFTAFVPTRDVSTHPRPPTVSAPHLSVQTVAPPLTLCRTTPARAHHHLPTSDTTPLGVDSGPIRHTRSARSWPPLGVSCITSTHAHAHKSARVDHPIHRARHGDRARIRAATPANRYAAHIPHTPHLQDHPPPTTCTMRHSDAMAIVRCKPGAYSTLSRHHRINVYVALVAVTGDGMLLERLPPALRDLEHLVCAAISQNPLAVQYASTRLRNDLSIGLDATIFDPHALEFLSLKLQAHPLLVSIACIGLGTPPVSAGDVGFGVDLSNPAPVSVHLSDLLMTSATAAWFALDDNAQGLHEAALYVLRCCPLLVEFTTAAMRADSAFMSALAPYAGSRAADFLRHASPGLLDDPNFMSQFIHQPCVIYLAGATVKSDFDTMLRLATEGENPTQWPVHGDQALLENTEFVTAVVSSTTSGVLEGHPDEARRIERGWLGNRPGRDSVLSCLGAEVRDTFGVGLAAVKVRGDALQYLSVRLRGNAEIVRAALANDPFAIQYALNVDVETAVTAVRGAAPAYAHLDLEMQSNPAVVAVVLSSLESESGKWKQFVCGHWNFFEYKVLFALSSADALFGEPSDDVFDSPEQMRPLVKLYGEAIFREVAKRPKTAAVLAPAAVLADPNCLDVDTIVDCRGDSLMYLCTLAFSSSEGNWHRLLELIDRRDHNDHTNAEYFARHNLPGRLRHLIKWAAHPFYSLDFTLEDLETHVRESLADWEAFAAFRLVVVRIKNVVQKGASVSMVPTSAGASDTHLTKRLKLVDPRAVAGCLSVSVLGQHLKYRIGAYLGRDGVAPPPDLIGAYRRAAHVIDLAKKVKAYHA